MFKSHYLALYIYLKYHKSNTSKCPFLVWRVVFEKVLQHKQAFELSTNILMWAYVSLTRGSRKISGYFMLLSFHVQLTAHSMRRVFTLTFEHFNKVAIRATMDSKLDEQRTVIQILNLDCKNLYHIFHRLQNFVLKPTYPVQPIASRVYSLRKTWQAWGTSLG